MRFNHRFKIARGIVLALSVLSCLYVSASACTQPPGYGFSIGYSYKVYADGILVTTAPIPGTGLTGTYMGPYDSTTTGATNQYRKFTSGTGGQQSVATFNGAATPGYWTIVPFTGACTGRLLANQALFRASNVPVSTACIERITGALTFTPAPIIAGSPVSVNIQSANLNGTYGAALAEVYSPIGDLVFSAQAGVNGNGSVDVVFDLEPGLPRPVRRRSIQRAARGQLF